MKKNITIYVMGEKFNLSIEEEFFEFVKEDLEKIQYATPKDILKFVLDKNQKEFESNKLLKKILKKVENIK